VNFIQSKVWDQDILPSHDGFLFFFFSFLTSFLTISITPKDTIDPITSKHIPYGKFLLAFDFHITTNGPRLIEVHVVFFFYI
jgi:hypothetical protein